MSGTCDACRQAIRLRQDAPVVAPGRHFRVEMSVLDEAAARWRRGEIADALHYLERALPYDFAGLAQLAPENRL